MVRILVCNAITSSKRYIEAAGLSTDAKPINNVVTGSLFLEVDTGDVYSRNEDGTSGDEWMKICELGGSGA